MVWETGDRTTRSSVHTLAEADAIEKCWAAIGKEVPIVVNYANFYRTPAAATTTDPTQPRRLSAPWSAPRTVDEFARQLNAIDLS
jgi:hypothetical protein